jgi:PncC family amidohydrolase
MSIPANAQRVAELLQVGDRKVVFAESCTGGLVSGALTGVPGISNYHCGSLVVYRNETKLAWLDIPAAMLKDPGPVSPAVAARMARGALNKTPEADVAVSVTGHLGPQAPPELDGVAFSAIVWRSGKKEIRRLDCHLIAGRSARQRWVVEQVLDFLAEELTARSR